MMGPSTFDGGYSSPSQVISSAMFNIEEEAGADTLAAGELVKATVLVCAIGAKADTVDTARSERRKESLFIVD